jgi:vacuolar-type H+-ATPase subunit I/STV1
MGFVRRTWTPAAADRWSREDTIAVVISPIIYMLLMLGVALAALGRIAGYLMIGAGVVLVLLLVYVIHPKLSAVSGEYERKQKGYLEELDRKMKWEE